VTHGLCSLWVKPPGSGCFREKPGAARSCKPAPGGPVAEPRRIHELTTRWLPSGLAGHRRSPGAVALPHGLEQCHGCGH